MIYGPGPSPLGADVKEREGSRSEQGGGESWGGGGGNVAASGRWEAD